MRNFTFKSKVMQVGNSKCMILPHIVTENYNLSKGDTMIIVLHEEGLFLIKKPIKSKDALGTTEQKSK